MLAGVPAAPRSRGPLVLVVLGALVLAGAVAAWSARRGLAEGALSWALRSRGVAPVQVTVSALGPGHLRLEDLRLGEPPDLAVERVEAAWSPGSLARGRLESLRVAGAELRGTLGEEGLRLGALDPLLGGEEDAGGAGESAAGPPPLPALPARTLELERARATIDTPRGPATLDARLHSGETDGAFELRGSVAAALAGSRLEAEIRGSGPPDALRGRLGLAFEPAPEPGALAVRLDPWRADVDVALAAGALTAEMAPVPFGLRTGDAEDAVRVEGETPGLDLRWDTAGLSLETRDGRVALPGLGAEAVGLAVEAAQAPGEPLPRGRVRVGRIADTRTVARFPALAVDGRFEPGERGLAFALAAADPFGRVGVDAEGSHGPDTGSGRAQVHLRTLRFEPGGVQPDALSPVLAGLVSEFTGQVIAAGSLRWGGEEGLRGGLDVALRDVSGVAGPARLRGLHGTVRVEGPPPHTPPEQQLFVGLVDVGLPLEQVLVTWSLRRDGRVELDATAGFAGGRVHASGVVDPTAETQRLVLDAEDVDLAELLERVNLAGLTGEGRLAGRIPLVRRGDTLAIDQGVLRAQEPGVLRYGGGVLPAGQAGVQILRRALQNLHYEKLEIRVDGTTTGSADVTIHLVGANPDYQEGRPVDYTLNLDARLADLVRTAVGAYQVPQRIQERLEKVAGGTP